MVKKTMLMAASTPQVGRILIREAPSMSWSSPRAAQPCGTNRETVSDQEAFAVPIVKTLIIPSIPVVVMTPPKMAALCFDILEQ